MKIKFLFEGNKTGVIDVGLAGYDTFREIAEQMCQKNWLVNENNAINLRKVLIIEEVKE